MPTHLTKLMLLFAFLLGQACWAQENRIEFDWGRGQPKTSLNAGASSDSAGERGVLWSADFLHYFKPLMAFGVGGGHFRSNDHYSGTFVRNANSTIDSKATSILGLLRMDLASNAPLTPYILVGAGWVRNSFSVTSTPNGLWADTSTNERRTILDDSQVALAYAGALGVDYNLNDRWYLGLEGRFQGSTSKTFDLTRQGTALTGAQSLDSTLPVLSISLHAGVKY